VCTPTHSFLFLDELEDGVFVDTALAELSSLHHVDSFNLFFMTEFIDHLGVSPQFVDGTMVWNSTGSNGVGSMSSPSVINLMHAFCKLIKSPSSITERSRIFYLLWDGSFNEAAIRDFILFYCEDLVNGFSRYISNGDLVKATKKTLIDYLISWNVPFVPYTAWDEFIIRASSLRVSNPSSLIPLSIEVNRLSFYVRHGVIADSRTTSQIAVDNGFSQSVEDQNKYKASAISNAAFLNAFSKSFAVQSPTSVKPKVAPVKPNVSNGPLKTRMKIASIAQSDDSRLALLGNYVKDVDVNSGDESSSSSSLDSSGNDGDGSSSSLSSNSGSSSSVSPMVSKGKLASSIDVDLQRTVVKTLSRLKRAKQQLADLSASTKAANSASKKKSKKSKEKSKSKRKLKEMKKAKSQGLHHYNTCVKELDTLIKNRGFINFYEYTHDRRNALKQLGSKSKPATNIGGVWISSSSPQIPDAASVLRSTANLASGFYFYLTRLTAIPRMSHLNADRIQWWSWLAAKFCDSDSAMLHFVNNFMLLHHAADSWHDTAQAASQMYTDARRYGDANPCSPTYPANSSDQHDRNSKRHKKSPVVVKSQHRTPWTQQQQEAVKALRDRCPANTCSSRVISNLKCAAERRGKKCKFTHVCGWCANASCEAQCSKTPASPVL
jgi:hypothetical protein